MTEEELNSCIENDAAAVVDEGDSGDNNKQEEIPPSDANHDECPPSVLGLSGISDCGDIVTLSEFKKFLNLEGIDYDDDILQLTLDSAISYCNKVNETEYTRADCPPEVKFAILGLAAHYFEKRTGEESQSEKAALKGVHRLLAIAREKITL